MWDNFCLPVRFLSMHLCIGAKECLVSLQTISDLCYTKSIGKVVLAIWFANDGDRIAFVVLFSFINTFHLQDKIEERFKYFIHANAEASIRKCRTLLQQLETTLRTKFERGDYAKNGGFAEFQKDLRDIQQKYKSHKDLGVQVQTFKWNS